jgi:phosphate-selective porin
MKMRMMKDRARVQPSRAAAIGAGASLVRERASERAGLPLFSLLSDHFAINNNNDADDNGSSSSDKRGRWLPPPATGGDEA